MNSIRVLNEHLRPRTVGNLPFSRGSDRPPPEADHDLTQWGPAEGTREDPVAQRWVTLTPNTHDTILVIEPFVSRRLHLKCISL